MPGTSYDSEPVDGRLVCMSSPPPGHRFARGDALLPTHPPHPTRPHTNTNKNQKVDLAPLLDHCEMARVNLPLCRPGQRRPTGKGLLTVRKMVVLGVVWVLVCSSHPHHPFHRSSFLRPPKDNQPITQTNTTTGEPPPPPAAKDERDRHGGGEDPPRRPLARRRAGGRCRRRCQVGTCFSVLMLILYQHSPIRWL